MEEIEKAVDEEAEAVEVAWADRVDIDHYRNDWRASMKDRNYRERVLDDAAKEKGRMSVEQRISDRNEEEMKTTVALT